MGGRDIDYSQFQFSKTFFTIANNLKEAEINLENAKKYHRKQKYYNVRDIERYEKEVNYFRERLIF